LEKLKGTDFLGDLRIEERIILKFILKRSRLWTGFNLLKAMSNVRLS
jgi:hypothetical protein